MTRPERNANAADLRIFFEISIGPRRHAGIHRRLRDGRRDAQDQARIERARNQRARAEALGLVVEAGGTHRRRLHARQLRRWRDRGDLHFLVDRRRAAIECAAEDEREAQDVVDLVRKSDRPVQIIASGGLARFVRHDFRVGLASAITSGLSAIALDHLGLQHAGADTPRKISAPAITSPSTRASVFCA
jgi:hypothetical protein